MSEINITELNEIQENLENAKAQKNRLLGQKESILQQLADLGHPNMESAVKALETATKAVTKQTKIFVIELQQFKDTYPELVE